MVVITSFSKALYEAYAHRVIETFSNWPFEATLIVYSEDIREHVGPDSIEFRSLNFPDLLKFKAACQPTEDYRYDAARFANKVWAMVEGSMNESGLVFWLDADCVTYRKPSAEFLKRLIPKSHYMGSFQRPSYVETGFWGVRANHEQHKPFMTALKDVYLSGKIFKLPQWHDCFALDHTREAFTKAGLIQTTDLTKTLNGRGSHPIATSQLGKYICHLKGNRKSLGYSPENPWRNGKTMASTGLSSQTESSG